MNPPRRSGAKNAACFFGTALAPRLRSPTKRPGRTLWGAFVARHNAPLISERATKFRRIATESGDKRADAKGRYPFEVPARSSRADRHIGLLAPTRGDWMMLRVPRPVGGHSTDSGA